MAQGATKFMLQFWFRVSVFVLVLTSILLGTASCSSKERASDEPIIESIEEARVESKDRWEEGTEAVELKPAYFDYDSARLRADGKAALKVNAIWLKKHKEASIQIEGRCDERGTQEYNLRLGQQRAESAKRYLIALGIKADRITTISIGAVPGSSASIRAKNRNAAGTIVYFKSGSK